MWPFSKKSEPIIIREEAPKYQPPRYRIVTTKKAPYKFYVESWRKACPPALNLEYDRLPYYDVFFVEYKKYEGFTEDLNWYPVAIKVGTKEHFHRYDYTQFDSYKTKLFDNELDAESYIRGLIKKDEELHQLKLEAERKIIAEKIEAQIAEEKLQEFINQHPPRNYP